MASQLKQKKSRQTILLEFIEEVAENDTYTTIRNPYLHSEFIPVNVIPTIMKHVFPSSELILSFTDSHATYKMRIDDLINGLTQKKVKNWEHNRPPDMARCPDIAHYIYKFKTPIETMFYLSFNNRKDVFEVLDGIHRLTALQIIKEENSKQVDLLEPEKTLASYEFGYNGDAHWLYNQFVFVNIRFNSSKAQLYEFFENLNKCQTVPELYVRDPAKEKRFIIDNIADEWAVKYKKHFSSADKPIAGNTNRCRFVSLLDVLYEKHQIDEFTGNKLRKLLDDANRKISENIPTKTSVTALVKCKETGCYLFLHNAEKLAEII